MGYIIIGNSALFVPAVTHFKAEEVSPRKSLQLNDIPSVVMHETGAIHIKIIYNAYRGSTPGSAEGVEDRSKTCQVSNKGRVSHCRAMCQCAIFSLRSRHTSLFQMVMSSAYNLTREWGIHKMVFVFYIIDYRG